jgi:hypothetical protein
MRGLVEASRDLQGDQFEATSSTIFAPDVTLQAKPVHQTTTSSANVTCFFQDGSEK